MTQETKNTDITIAIVLLGVIAIGMILVAAMSLSHGYAEHQKTLEARFGG